MNNHLGYSVAGPPVEYFGSEMCYSSSTLIRIKCIMQLIANELATFIISGGKIDPSRECNNWKPNIFGDTVYLKAGPRTILAERG